MPILGIQPYTVVFDRDAELRLQELRDVERSRLDTRLKQNTVFTRLAGLVGSTRANVTRALRQLEAAGQI